MKLVYFAWIRERIGLNEEEVDLDSNVKTVGDLLNWLKTRGEEFEALFEQPELIRVALDQVHSDDPGASLSGVREVALFPPMTGG